MGLLMSQAQSWCESRRFINLWPLSLDETWEYWISQSCEGYWLFLGCTLYLVPCTYRALLENEWSELVIIMCFRWELWWAASLWLWPISRCWECGLSSLSWSRVWLSTGSCGSSPWSASSSSSSAASTSQRPPGEITQWWRGSLRDWARLPGPHPGCLPVPVPRPPQSENFTSRLSYSLSKIGIKNFQTDDVSFRLNSLTT